jgi:HEAT repeat protein
MALRQRAPYHVEGDFARPACDVGRLWLRGDIAALDQVVHTGDLIAARFALEALDAIEDPSSVDTYLWCLETLEDDVGVLAAAALAVGHAGECRAVPLLLALLDYDYSNISEHQEAAAIALGELNDPAVIPVLVAKVTDSSVADAAMEALSRIGGPQAAAGLLSVLHDIWWYPGLALALRTLGAIGDRQAIPAVAEIASMPGEWGTDDHDDDDDDGPYADRMGALMYRGGVHPDVRRAAVEALGRLGGTEVVKPLIRALRDPDEQTAAQAAIALRSLPQARSELIDALGAPEAHVRSTVCGVLATLADPRAVPALARVLATDRSGAVRAAAATALGRFDVEQARFALHGALNDSHGCLAAATELARRPDTPAGTFAEMLARGTEAQRCAAAAALGAIAGPVDISILAAAVDDGTVAVRRAAVDALGQRGDIAAAPPLVDALRSDNQPGTVRARAAAALGALGDADQAVEPLIQALGQASDPVRLRAAEALGRIRADSAIAALESAAASDSDVAVRAAAIDALAAVGGPGVAALARLARKAPASQRAPIVRALGRSEAEESIPYLATVAASGDAGERLTAVEALTMIPSPLTIEPLRAALAAGADDPWASETWQTSELVLNALARYDDRAAIETVLHEFSFGSAHAAAHKALAEIAARRPNVSWLAAS